MKNNKFSFTYSAPTSEERKEIENIRNSYLTTCSSSGDKLQQLRKLDRKVKTLPNIISLAFGIVGILIFGLGLSMILEWRLLTFGIIVSIIGIVPIIFAYPIHKFLTKLLKNKYSTQILKLSEELLNNEDKN